MIGVRVTLPIACFRKGLAREFLETEPLPPPATCYGFLLSLIGETQRERHVGARVCPVLVGKPETSVVLRTVWRVKKTPLGSPGNTRPDYQQLLSPVEVVIWLDSSAETATLNLERRVFSVVVEKDYESIRRFGGLSLGESTHLVNEVCRFAGDDAGTGQAFLLNVCGRLTLPVWVDHVGSAGTNYATGDLKSCPLIAPPLEAMPLICPKPVSARQTRNSFRNPMPTEVATLEPPEDAWTTIKPP
jgi:CRISPR-associated protein Cas5t